MSHPYLAYLLAFAFIVGSLKVLAWLKTLLSFLILKRFFSPSSVGKFIKKGESWAVVTGASDGIGKEYAIELARRGSNVCLVGRSKEKLDAVQEEIKKSTPNAQTRVVIIDLAHANEATWAKFAAEIADLNATILINNAGVSYDMPAFLHELDSKRLKEIVDLNITALTMVTQIVIRSMVTKKKGLILNISSISSVIPAPLLSVYGASKSYVNHFSQNIQFEYANKGIVVENITPSFVSSKMSKIKKTSAMVPSAKTFARASLGALGTKFNTGYFFHDVMIWLTTKIIPKSYVASFVISQGLAAIKRRAARDKKEGETKQ
jgi:17beta-estradiol 17-dehydrogenase / very-long-chain 3-oxoacyl-CoA reductase